MSQRVSIATVMRVKNEEKYIAQAIHSLLPLDGEIVVLDDGSNDATPDIVRSFDRVHYHRQDDKRMDEGRDRTFLLKEALKLEPEWIFTLDGDEELDKPTPARMLAAMEQAPDHINVFMLHLAVMAVGGKWYGPRSIWKMDRLFRTRDAYRSHKFRSNFKSNLHCGCVPKMKNYSRQILNAFIKYWGYEDMASVQRKMDFYKKHDPAHYPAVKERALERLRWGKRGWKPGLDCREIGIHLTTIY